MGKTVKEIIRFRNNKGKVIEEIIQEHDLETEKRTIIKHTNRRTIKDGKLPKI